MELLLEVLFYGVLGAVLGFVYYFLAKPKTARDFVDMVLLAVMIAFVCVVIKLMFGGTVDSVLHSLATYLISIAFYLLTILQFMQFGKAR